MKNEFSSTLFDQGRVRKMIETTADPTEAARKIYDYYLELRGKKDLVESVLNMYKKLDFTMQEIAVRKKVSISTVHKIINWKYL